MLTNSPFVSIIVPSYNRASMLGITLESFVHQDYPIECFEIIVADNNSTDRTKEAVLEWQQQTAVKIRYIFEPRQGVHYARNSAAKQALGEILYFTDDDMIADRMLIKNIVSGFSLTKNVGVVTGKVIPKWEAPPPEWILQHCQNALLSVNFQDHPEKITISSLDVGVYSCHEAIRRDIFFQSGGFNPENTAGEWIGDGETGLHIKIQALGCDFVYIGSSIIHHMIPPARMTQNYLNRRLENQGNCDAYTEYRKHRHKSADLIKSAIFNYLESCKCFSYRSVVRFVLGKSSWRIRWARGHYHWRKASYFIRLFKNVGFRNYVLRMNWLDE